MAGSCQSSHHGTRHLIGASHACRAGNSATYIAMPAARPLVSWPKAKVFSLRPVADLCAKRFAALVRNTGAPLLTRGQLARLEGIAAQPVSGVTGEAEEGSTAICRNKRVPALLGSDGAHGFIKPVASTHIAGRARNGVRAKFSCGWILQRQGGWVP